MRSYFNWFQNKMLVLAFTNFIRFWICLFGMEIYRTLVPQTRYRWWIFFLTFATFSIVTVSKMVNSNMYPSSQIIPDFPPIPFNPSSPLIFFLRYITADFIYIKSALRNLKRHLRHNDNKSKLVHCHCFQFITIYHLFIFIICCANNSIRFECKFNMVTLTMEINGRLTSICHIYLLLFCQCTWALKSFFNIIKANELSILIHLLIQLFFAHFQKQYQIHFDERIEMLRGWWCWQKWIY